MRRIIAEIVVIGGGPAGLSAATAAARAGANVHLVDAGVVAGGQYWMQGFGQHAAATRQSRAGAAAIAAARDAGVTFHLGMQVWAIFPGWHVCAAERDDGVDIEAGSIIIATGAHDRALPFPGWTLPGVVTPGAVQRLAKLASMPAGRRIVLAGSGPFLFAVAAALHGIGARPTALIEARRPAIGLLAHLVHYPERWAESLRLLTALGRSRPILRLGYVVIAALGRDHVEAVRIAPLGSDGTPNLDRTETLDGIDSLAVGWGFRPSIELTSLLGCAHAYDEVRGGWYCVCDALTGATSVSSIFAAGEVAGVTGAASARLSGARTGLAAARRPLRRPGVRLRRARSFGLGLNSRFTPHPAIMRDIPAETIVCRCEEVTRGQISAALAEGVISLHGLKLWTRAGMGSCQGRLCGWGIARLAAAELGTEPASLGFNRPRIPVFPVSLATALESTSDVAAAEPD